MSTRAERDAAPQLQGPGAGGPAPAGEVVPAQQTAGESVPPERPRQRFWRRFRANRGSMIASGVIIVLVLVAVLAPLLAPQDPNATSVPDRLQPPTGEHILGTDDLGRDVLSRLFYATRVSLMAAALAVGIATVLGTPFGLLAGYLGGRWDMAMSRFADALMAFPTLILALGIIAAMGPGLTNAMLALGIVYSPRLFRVVRAATLGVRTETFIEASISVGTPTSRIVRRHVLPNVMSPLTVQVTLMMAFALLAEASLSFLGLGVTPPDASWGTMLGRAFRDIRVAPFLIYWPGLAIAIATLAFNTVGDGIRDAMGREIRKGDE